MRDPKERLRDMFEAMTAIEGYLHRGKAAFEEDELLQGWFVRNLQIIGEAARNDYNLSPRRYVASNHVEEVLPLEEAVVLLREAEEKNEKATRVLEEVLGFLGLKRSEGGQ